MRLLAIINDALAPPALVGVRVFAHGGGYDAIYPDSGYDSRDPLNGAGAVPADASGYDGLLVFGGRMGANDGDDHPYLHDVERLMRAFACAGKPVMGVCLGAQIAARAFGGRVYRAPAPERGYVEVRFRDDARRDPVLGGAPRALRIMQWHDDTFDLPAGARWLAQSDACPAQAFVVDDVVYAFQFHLEATPDIVRVWMQTIAARGGDVSPALARRVEAGFDAHAGAQARFTAEVCERWFELARARAG